ncbi:MAG: DnaA regulatory inactivator Hda, partial [Gammaproteobacteria bacterium]|nr:DnaA regulatory inactivator Hda [Gammaproteobacteria bacterium]
MNSKHISLPQIPFEFGNFQKIDFASFIEGENQDLLDFLITVTKKKKNDCLYIWGSQGTGKTHLLQAACKQADDMNSQVTYIPLKQHEEFDSEIFNGLGKLDLICVDDLEFISGNLEWQQRLTLLYNEIRDNNNSIIISSTSSPKNIKIELDDLKSRLVWGQVHKIKPPNDELKIEILKRKASERSFELSESVAEFLIHRTERDLNSLIKILDVIDHSSL